MTVILTGGTGLIGQALTKKLVKNQYNVHWLSRRLAPSLSSSHKVFLWPDMTKDTPPLEAFPQKYGLIHLAGEPLFQFPWTRQKKKRFFDSRIKSTQRLVQFISQMAHPPQFFLSASAIGIYGERGDESLTENSPSLTPQKLFLQKVCQSWEEEVLKAKNVCRTLIFRIGVVLSYKKGFLFEQKKLPFAPAVFSGGRACWLSWIALEDLVDMILWVVEDKQTCGIYNATSPHPVLLKDFYTAMTTQSKSKKISIPIPLFLLRRVGGEMTKNLLVSVKAFPEKALSEGFVFKLAQLEEALQQKSL